MLPGAARVPRGALLRAIRAVGVAQRHEIAGCAIGRDSRVFKQAIPRVRFGYAVVKQQCRNIARGRIAAGYRPWDQ